MTSDTLIEIKAHRDHVTDDHSFKRKKNYGISLIWGGSKYSGVLCMALSSLSYSFMGLFVKLLSMQNFPSLEIVFARSLMVAIASGIQLQRRNHPFLGSKRSRHFVVVRGLIGFVSLSTFFYSIQLLPLRDAIVLNFTMPVFTSIFAFFFLNEKWGRKEIAGSLLGFVGMILVTQPSSLFPNENGSRKNKYGFGGVFFSLLASSTGAISYILVRAVGKFGEPPWVCVFAFSAFSTPLSFLGIFFQKFKIPDFAQFVFLTLVGLTALFAQLFLTRALQLEKASKATSIQYVKVVVTYALGIICLNEIPTFYGVLGTILVISSAFSLTYS